MHASHYMSCARKPKFVNDSLRLSRRIIALMLVFAFWLTSPGSVVLAANGIESVGGLLTLEGIKIESWGSAQFENLTYKNTIFLFPEPDFSSGNDGSAVLFPERIISIAKESFQSVEDIELKVKNVRSASEVKIIVQNSKGEKVEVPVAEKFSDTTKTFTISTYGEIKPGAYEIKVIDASGKTVLTQDFSWGVLAFNTNKSIYNVGEQGNIAIAVLNDLGEMVCDARVTLRVHDPKGQETVLSTEDKSIIVNKECELKDFTLNPDYETAYTTTVAGRYFAELTAETQNGIYTTSDWFEVQENLKYDIERITATRIYPLKDYPVIFKIKANEDFSGSIIERVPGQFAVSRIEEFRGVEVASFDSEEGLDSEKSLIWEDVKLSKGDEIMLGYVYDAPNISPEFYLLGPFEFGSINSEGAVFTEARRWQIASDDTTSARYVGTGADSGADWTSPTNAEGDTTSTAATISLGGNGTVSSNLILTNFGFTTSDVPAGSTILGVTVEVEWQAGATNIVDNNVQLTTDGSTGTGTSQALGTTQGTKGFRTYGGASNTWGASPTAAQVVSSNFGVVLNYLKNSGGGSTTTSVFRARMTIEYTPPAPTIEGTVFLENEFTEATTGNGGFCDGTTENLSLRVDGGAAVTETCSSSDGTFTFSLGSAVSAGSTVTIYSTDATHKANRVYVSNGTPDTGQNLFINTLIVADDQDGTLSILDILDYDNTHNATDMLFDAVDATPDTLTVDDGIELHIWAGDNFTPGGTITTSPSSSAASNDGDVHVPAGTTLNMGANSLSVGGSLEVNAGTLTLSSGQTITFTATSTGHTVSGAGSSFENLVFNGTGGGWEFLVDPITINGDLTMTAGTLSDTSSVSVGGGDVTGNGDINMTGGTFTVSGAGDFGGDTAWDFNNLTFSGASQTTNTTGTGSVVVAGVMTIGADHTLEAGAKVWTLAGSGTPFVNSGTFTPETSKISYTNTTSATVTSTTFYDLEFSPASGTPTYTFGSTNLIVNNDLILTGAGAPTVDADTNDPAIDVNGDFTISSGVFEASSADTFTIAGNFTNNGTLTHNNGTVTFDTTGTTQLAYSGNTTFYGLDISVGGKTVEFDEAQQTIVTNNLNIQGTDCTTGRIYLKSVVNSNQWDMVTTGATVDIDYADVRDGNAVTTAITANNSTADNNNNTNWTVNNGVCSVTPSISDVSPTSIYNGQTGIVITGTTFEASQGTGKVELASSSDYGAATKVEQTETAWGDTEITFTAVQGALTRGTVYVFVTNDTGDTSTGYSVTLTEVPSISVVSPASFYDGQTSITITGTSFYASQTTGNVELGSSSDYGTATKVSQTETAWGDTSITFTAVQGALTRGTVYVFVTNSDGNTSTGYAVTLTEVPSISAVNPSTFNNTDAGIVITGGSFYAGQGTGTVELGSSSNYGSAMLEGQTVTAWGDTEITFTVIRGSLDLGTVYVFVTNDDGNTSEGYAVTLNAAPEPKKIQGGTRFLPGTRITSSN